MRRLIAAAALAATALSAGGAHATHGGCVVHAAQTSCTYTSVGSHSATGYSQGPWEVTVMRSVGGVPTKVTVGGGSGGAIVASDVAATLGEVATIVIKPAA